ncbi:ABC transporter ATP-binding protein [Acidilutibacter cellobiosedens]|jgi:ATP-binding cassette subfamily B protein|uniref:ABC transporter ATP-binding protein n=1 Tax=Acidilutibacter cellobiosedens TaxID=2507161 RepID=A0A410QAL5_9FIRM|nr:ABC transporter ATP-binding protein [Acidilutibacter cellobiosedens]QAT61036.1 ABC transporter ATP-binding protein [Acidilutibacter cellobiosedens]
MEKSKSLLFYAGNYKILTYLACIFSGISALLALIPFIYIWKVVEEIFRVAPDITKAEGLPHYGLMAVVFAVLSMLIYFAALMCSHIAAFRTARNMRSMTLNHLMKLPLGFFEENGSGKLRRIIDESSGQTETYLAHMLPDLAGAYVTPVGVIVLLFVFDWRLGIISLIPFVIGIVFLMKMMGPSLAGSMKEYQNALEDMNNQAVEYVRGIPVVKTFQQSVYSFRNFHESILRYRKWAINYTISLRMPMCGYTVSINGIFAFLIPAGVLLILSAVDYKAFLLDFIFYIIFTPICTVMMNKIMFSSENAMLAKDAQRRIESILNEKPFEKAKSPAVPKKNDISFEHVSFTYKGGKVPALKDVSFQIKEGKTVALVGPSGGGKTTAASLVPRFWDVDEGKVSIGGVDVRNMDEQELMNRVAFVFQDNHLFKTSILENIRISKPSASREEVLTAAKAAMCTDIIDKLPNGMDTVVGTKGVYLSGGEIQRITLARAILKDAPIIILDEATAFADPENEYQIQKAFDRLTKGKTILIIAHRLSTVKNADQILVIVDGSIAEQGTHQELLQKNKVYARMWTEYESSATWKVTVKGGAKA